MSYREDFGNSTGWSIVDVSTRLNTSAGRKFLDHLRANGVSTVIRYYASSNRTKTITAEEARFISKEGFGILPVFQDSARNISNFSRQTGIANARSAAKFAKQIGQPAGQGSTILFAVDADFTARQIDGPIVDYFKAIRTTIGESFTIGAYGSGAVLAKLLSERLIGVAWISMSRGFLGTQQFFYSDRWTLRQVPPETHDPASGVGYDRNVTRVLGATLGAFQVDDEGQGSLVGEGNDDATLGGGTPTRDSDDAEPAGADRFVTTEGLRLRDSPNGNVIRDLTIGDRLRDLGAIDSSRWRKVRIGHEEGVVFDQYLRKPVRREIELLLRAALDEWLRFEKGRADEKADPYYRYVREMWAAIGEPYDGRSLYADGKEVPWSAAFVSWVVGKAGPAYANFQFASSHSVFVNNAIKARVTGRADKPFWGYRIDEAKPEIGDIVQRNRGTGSFTYSYAENHTSYASHSDFVVEVKPDVVRVLGGNVSNTVSMRGDLQEYRLDATGFIAGGQRVIALLKNRAGIAA